MTYGTRTDHYPATSKLLHWLVADLRPHHGPGGDRDDPHQRGADPGHALQFPQVAGRPDPDPDDPAADQSARRGRADRRTGDRALAEDRFVGRDPSFYVLLLAMPIVGYIANSAYGAPTPFFGLFDLPPIVEQERDALNATVHHPSLGGLAPDHSRPDPCQRSALSPLCPRR